MKLIRALAALLVVASCGPVFAQTLYFLEDDTGRFYSLNTSTGAATQIGTISAVTSDTIGLTESPDPQVLYATTWTRLIHFNVDGSNVVDVGPSPAEGLAWCINTNVLYGALNGNFFSIDPATGVQTPLASPPTYEEDPEDVEGLACIHSANQVYGVGRTSGNLVRYDAASNTWASIGATGVALIDPGLAYDPAANVLYMLDGGTGNLYRVNPATAVATLIGPTGLGDAGGGLAFTTARILPPATTSTPIPMVGTWALAALLLGLLGAGLFTLRGTSR